MFEQYSRGHSKSLQDKVVRLFLNKCFSFETERKGGPEADDHFATLEIKSLMLIKKAKEQNSKDKAAENDKTETTKEDPEKKKKMVKAKILDPFKNAQKKSYDCPFCDKTYDASSIKSLQFHCRKHHPDKPKLSKKDYEEEAEVECELLTRKGKRCGSSYPRHQLRRHLERKKIHKKPQIKPEGKVFRAWRFFEDDVEVLWKASADEEIPSEEDVEVEDEMVEEGETSGNEDVPEHNENSPAAFMDNQVEKDIEIETPVEPEKEKGKTIEVSQMGDIEETFPDQRLDLEKKTKAGTVALELINDDETETISATEQNNISSDVQDNAEFHDHNENVPGAHMPMVLEDGDQNIISTSMESEKCQIKLTNVEHETIPVHRRLDSDPLVEMMSPAEETGIQPVGTGLLNDLWSERVILVNPNSIQSLSRESDETEVVEYIVCPPVPVVDIRSSVFLSSVVPEETSDVEMPDSFQDSTMSVPEANMQVEVQSVDSTNTNMQATSIDELLNYSTSGDMRSQEKEAFMMESNVETESLLEDEDGLNQIITSTSQETVYEEQQAISFKTVKDKLLDEDRKRVRFMIDQEVWSCQDEKIQDVMFPKESETMPDSASEESDASIDSEYDEDLDSDILITKKRQERKKVRLMNRNNIEASIDLTEIKENKEFIQNFNRWLTNKTSLQTTNPKPDNISSKMGHAFSHHDSFLNYMTSKNAKFNLNRLIDFKNKDNFLAIESPVEWISCASGSDPTANPTRHKDQLKTHATLRAFISHKLNMTAFDGNDIILTMVVNNQLQAIEKEVSDSQLFAKYRNLYEKDKNKAKRMKVIANPSIHQLEFDSVRTWFASNEAKELEAEVRRICKEALEKRKFTARNWGKVANLARFNLAILDRNRPSSYNFTNMDYMAKIRCWLPEGTENLWSLESLPQGWKMFEERDESPTCFIISLDGSQAQIKLQAETNIIMDMKTYEIIELYQDLKKMHFGKLSPKDPFFVNHKGNQLSRLQRCKGSLVELFGNTVGLPDFKMTDARKQLEGAVQGSRVAKHTKDINNHSSAVGSAVYDNTKLMRRSVFMSSMAADESSSSASKDEVKQHYNLRSRGDEEARGEVEKHASAFLDQRKKKKPVANLTPNSLKKDDIRFLTTIFTDDDIKGKLTLFVCKQIFKVTYLFR